MNRFKSKLHLVCAKDPLRPSMQHIHFIEGKAVATDAHILIEQSLTLNEFHVLVDLKKFDGKALHKNVFKELQKYDILSVDDEGIVVIKEGFKAKFMWAENPGTFPNYKNVLPNSPQEIKRICLNPNLAYKLSQAMICRDAAMPNLIYSFHGEHKAISVTTKYIGVELQQGIIMPINQNE